MVDVTVPMDDAELYRASTTDEKPAAEPERQPEPEARAGPEPQERPRDDQGRFAPREKAPEQQAGQQPIGEQPADQRGQPQPDPDQSAQVPSWRLRELREEREAVAKRAADAEERAQRYEAQLREFQTRQAQQERQQQKPPDMLADPDAWQQHVTSQQQIAVDRVRFELSEDAARDKFGDEKVNAALNWLQTNLDSATRQRITAARNPYREMVKLYDERQTLQQIGGDLGAYRTKLLDEALNDPGFLQRVADKLRADAGNGNPTNGQRPVVQLPPSLSRATGANIPRDGVTAEDMSDASLYRHATAPGRR